MAPTAHKRQDGKYSLDKLVAEFNNIARAGMSESPADLFFNRVVRSTLPCKSQGKETRGTKKHQKRAGMKKAVIGNI